MHLLAVLLLVCAVAVQPQHVPVKIDLKADEADTDPLAACSEDVIAATIDAIVPSSNSAAAIVLVSLQLEDMQLPGAVVFSAAGYTISLRSTGRSGMVVCRQGAGCTSKIPRTCAQTSVTWSAVCALMNSHSAATSAAGVMTLSTSSGSIDYLMGITNSAVEAVSLAFDGSKHRLCINLVCLQPQQVRRPVAPWHLPAKHAAFD
jgi:hypothetical protein